jgi:hypothetical protein
MFSSKSNRWLVWSGIVIVVIAVLSFFYSSTLLRSVNMTTKNASHEDFHNPFHAKLKVANNLYVEKTALYSKNIDSEKLSTADENFRLETLGNIAFSPKLQIRVDAVHNLVHFPSFFRLYEVQSNVLLVEIPVYSIETSVIYFSGDGAGYVNQQDLRLCGPRHTTKLILNKGRIQTEKQPLDFVGAETQVIGENALQLFEAAKGGQAVATVPAQTTVTVIGLLPGSKKDETLSMLVRTPFGLTGWHTANYSGLPTGQLNIYMCN